MAGHVNIEGNELVDKEVKLAAEGLTSAADLLLRPLKKPLKLNKSAAKQHFNARLKSLWKERWLESPCVEQIKHIDDSLPSQKFLKLISVPELSRKGASWLFQLRSSHIPLNVYLHRFKRTDNAQCPASGHHAETLQHFLLDCPAYTYERWPLMAGKSPSNWEYAKMLGNPKNAIPIMMYIQATGRFMQEVSRKDRVEAGRNGREAHRRDNH